MPRHTRVRLVLKADFPDIVIAATQTIGLPVRADGVQIGGNTLAVDPEFVQIFDLDVTAGSADGLTAPRSVLLEEAAAREPFGSADAVGRSVQLCAGWLLAFPCSWLRNRRRAR